jgi:hypothetical protein
MKIFSLTPDSQSIHQRAMSLYLGKDYALQFIGSGKLNARQESEQENRRRELLAVEQQAQREKLLAEHAKAQFKEHITVKIDRTFTSRLLQLLDSPEKLYQSVLQVNQAAPDALELLSLNAASLKRVTPLIKSVPWLAQELVHLVNKPQYRKRADVIVQDPALAVNYLGIENLQLTLPTFMLKRWLPVSTQPFPLLKRKLWNDSFAIGLATKNLAEAANIDSFTAFTAAMFSNIGYFTVTRCYLALFQDIHSKALRKAFENKDKRLHDVLLTIKPPADVLLNLLVEKSHLLSAQLVEMMQFERLAITEPLFDIAYIDDIDKMHPIAQLIIKAKAYVDCRSLQQDNLLTDEEKQQCYQLVRITEADLALLRKADIDHLKLSFG